MSATILLIEDNPENRYLATFLLRRLGHVVVEAFDGKAGLAIAEKLVPDLVLLDIQLPGMDGYAVASALRSIERLRSVPIVAVTSYAMLGDREKTIEAGCNGYIEKPINPDTFSDEVMVFLKNKIPPQEKS
jgi:two-component system cell cycle response regulator DivK